MSTGLRSCLRGRSNFRRVLPAASQVSWMATSSLGKRVRSSASPAPARFRVPRRERGQAPRRDSSLNLRAPRATLEASKALRNAVLPVRAHVRRPMNRYCSASSARLAARAARERPTLVVRSTHTVPGGGEQTVEREARHTRQADGTLVVETTVMTGTVTQRNLALYRRVE